MEVYLLNDSNGNLHGVYLEEIHVYKRMVEYRDTMGMYKDESRVDFDWTVYKIPVGEYEDTYIPNLINGGRYVIELPDTYDDMRGEIRDFKIKELIE